MGCCRELETWRAKEVQLSNAGRSTNVFGANFTESNIQMTDTIWPKAPSIYDLRGPGPAAHLLFLHAAVSPTDLTPRKKLRKKDVRASHSRSNGAAATAAADACFGRTCVQMSPLQLSCMLAVLSHHRHLAVSAQPQAILTPPHPHRPRSRMQHHGSPKLHN